MLFKDICFNIWLTKAVFWAKISLGWEVIEMAWSYNRLWIMLINRGIKRTQLLKLVGISTSALAKMGKNQTVTMDTLGKLCQYFNCNIEDIVEFIPEGQGEPQ